jgi:hypothetical protein
MTRWFKIATATMLLCPLLASGGVAPLRLSAFDPGREYHSGHSARPHRVHQKRKQKSKKSEQRKAPTSPDNARQ